MMKIIIVEDEIPAYKRLSKMILEILPDAVIEPQLDSIKSVKQWLLTNTSPDVAFMDIHLSDGTVIELIEKEVLDFPVIFTTAYSEYSIEAFKTPTIDYLLKPIKKSGLEKAFQSLKKYEKIFQQKNRSETTTHGYKKRFIIRFGENIKTLKIEDIAYFVSMNKGTFARTFSGRYYPIDYNLETLSDIVDPVDFFRINRQYLISLNAITEMKSYSKARVIISLNPEPEEKPVVSSERASGFKKWLGGEL